tara:strand:+ start:1265 stop:2398 length:1134 start_codon:yes stop_codon:yes gene_type:complete
MAQTDHTHTTEEMATSTSYTYSFQGFQTEDYTTKIESYQDILYLDGKSIFSDGALSIGTSTSNPVYLGADSQAYLKIETDGKINFLSGKMSINGDTGSVGQVLSTDGSGNLSWATVDFTQYAFSNIAVSGEVTVAASSTSDTLTLAEGSGINITTSGSTVTIASDSSAHNAFKYIAPLDGAGSTSGNTITADSQSDTLTFVAGTGISLSFDENNDKITFEASQTGESNQNAITSVAVSGQSTLSAGQASETINFDSVTDRNIVEITTDTANKKVNFKTKLPRTLSMSGRIPTRLSDGNLSGMPINNHFINRTVSGVEVSGGGTSVGFSTRAVVCNEADGTVHKITMPASDNNSLLFNLRKPDNSVQEFEIDMAESNL